MNKQGFQLWSIVLCYFSFFLLCPCYCFISNHRLQAWKKVNTLNLSTPTKSTTIIKIPFHSWKTSRVGAQTQHISECLSWVLKIFFHLSLTTSSRMTYSLSIPFHLLVNRFVFESSCSFSHPSFGFHRNQRYFSWLHWCGSTSMRFGLSRSYMSRWNPQGSPLKVSWLQIKWNREVITYCQSWNHRAFIHAEE